ncbi:MAG: DUF3108 domain-containing protein [Bryobacteraceae bacterium]
MKVRRPFLLVPLSTAVFLGAAGSPWQQPKSATPVKVGAAEAPPKAALAAAESSAAKPESQPAGKPETPQPAKGFPNTSEALTYSVNWPTGLSLGEAHLKAAKSADGWQFNFSLDASVPGFAISDHYESLANSDLCSLELEKETTHGKRTAHEKTVFDYKAGTATRTTLVEGGGHTDINIGSCAHDGLDYVFLARRELSQGRMPQEHTVLFGAEYSVRMEYTGAMEVTVGDKRQEADHVVVHFKGPVTDSNVEIFFARDPARTPLVVKAPFALGTFSMELAR